MSEAHLAAAPHEPENPSNASEPTQPAISVAEPTQPEIVTPLLDASAPEPVAEPEPEPIPEARVEAPKPPEPKRGRVMTMRNAGRPALIAPTQINIDQIEPDEQFRLRELGDVAGLATSLARVGQLFPIDLRPRGGNFQVVSGFRRLAALKFLQRGTVLARVHEGLSDSEAWVFALAQALESRGLSPDEIRAIRDRLDQAGTLTTMTRGLIDAALTVPGSDLEPEDPNAANASDEVDLDELAHDLHERLNGISQDLALVTELWTALEPEPRAALLDQLRYYGELHAYLSRLR